MPEKIIVGNVLDQYHSDYQIYALYCEMNRCVPKDKDGLVPVQRRLVHCAYEYCHASSFLKCANIIGQTMSNEHPHGDEGIKSALYTLISWYQTKYPLFIGKGNFGNTYTNTGAATRYTETKLSPFTYYCVLDELIKHKEVVDWTWTYDKKSKEPLYLPVKVPLLLLNGSMHMSVGDKVDIPSHNICEVIDQVIALIQNPNHEVVLVPDHCQRCEIIDTDWAEICRRGFGTYKVRGIIEIKDYFGKTKKYKGRKVLAIRSCPNLTYLGTVMASIEKLVKDNKIIGIEDVEDESEIDDMNYILILRPGVDPNFVREAIYQNTRLQSTFRVNMKVFIDDGENVYTKRTSYTEYLKNFILYRMITKLRLYEISLQDIKTRLHVVENYIWAVESGKIDDEVLAMIRKQKNVDDDAMMEALIKKCKITDLQAKFIMNMDVKKLSQGYYKQFCAERDDLVRKEQECIDAITIDGRMEQIIIQELLDIKQKFGDPRKCRIISESEASGIPQGTFKITISEQGFVKKFSVEDNITGTKTGDSVKYVTVGDNTKNLLVFDINGKVYNLPISKIPFSDKNAPGTDIRVINKHINAPLSSIIYEPVLESYKKGYIVTVTKNGYIKRMTVEDFLSVPPSGLVYSKVDQGDYIVDILLFKNEKADIVVYNQAKALRMNISDIPILKRNSRGNISMGGSNHEVSGISVVKHNCTEVLGITAKGYINKISPDAVPIGRTKAGKNVIKLTKGDYLVSVLGTNESSNIRCLLSNGQLLDIPANTIPMCSSISSGTRINSTGFLRAWNL